MDFLVTLDDRPTLLVEVTASTPSAIPAAVHHFQAQRGARHALVAAFDLPFVERDCFDLRQPTVVPAATLLSQLGWAGTEERGASVPGREIRPGQPEPAQPPARFRSAHPR